MKALEEPINLWVHGISGRMGLEIRKLSLQSRSDTFVLVGGSSRSRDRLPAELAQLTATTPSAIASALINSGARLLLDFSSASGSKVLLSALESEPKLSNLSVLIGSTGMDAEDYDRWRILAGSRQYKLLFAPNTSVGILMAVKAACLIAPSLNQLGFDIEITETHHRRKQDAPSGTAKFLAEAVAASAGGLKVVTDRHGPRHEHELGVHAIRGGGVFGEHEVRLISESEEICISHRAFSRTLFADGALVLGRWLVHQKIGIYELMDVNPKDLLTQLR